MMLSTTTCAISSRSSPTALPRCGVSTTLGILSNSRSTLGSNSNTSRPAPAIPPRANARMSAASSTIGPRAVLMSPVFFLAQLGRADLVARLGLERRMQRHEIGFSEQLIERHVGQPRLTLLGFRLAARLPIEDPHGEAARPPRHCLADAATAADQAERLAVNPRTAEVIRLGAGEAPLRSRSPSTMRRATASRPEIEVGGRLDDHGRDDGHGNPQLGRRRDVDCPA